MAWLVSLNQQTNKCSISVSETASMFRTSSEPVERQHEPTARASHFVQSFTDEGFTPINGTRACTDIVFSLEPSQHPAPPPSTLRSLFCTKSAGDRRRERRRMGRERWSEGEAKNVSSNTTCHLILLKGQQLEIKTKFEINEAHSGGGIRFWSNKLLVSTSETAVPVCQLICLTLLLQTLMHSLTDTLAI